MFENFDMATFVMVQELIFPLVKTFTGFDTHGFVGDQSELFIRVGDSLNELAALFMVAGTALEDGKLSVEELEAFIAKAKTLPDALESIIGFFDGDDSPE